jgi:hypothetical protein
MEFKDSTIQRDSEQREPAKGNLSSMDLQIQTWARKSIDHARFTDYF